ncbi:hypothetical protein C8F04DRAFT_1256577 [Mycena alexandri]|uniref:F-box domain-containing protein n=1 Tax=Mycena alexandri TaxID=1745969 RepID=A0AAD6T4K5_9AGAR|nr:hypothetical protein C8F04DRAFT_1256577 [Mycena alexandri]
MLDLPQELTDRIIDDLHDDWRSLAECSLVCWAWVPASRFHIFSEITLRRKWGRMMHPQFRPFLNMLRTGSSTFAPFVAHLTLEDLDTTQAEGEEFSSAFSILSRLNSVTSLEFNRWRNLGLQPVQNLLPLLTDLSELTLDNVTVGSLDQLFGMLEMCPSLTSLAVISVIWETTSSRISYSHAGSIQTLRLISRSISGFLPTRISGFLDAFIPKTSQSKLGCKAVEIRGLMPEDTEIIGRFLDLVAGSLQQFRVGFEQLYEWGDVGERFDTHVDLQHQTQLTTFHLEDLGFPNVDSLTNLSMVKCALASPNLTKIVFSLSLYSAEQLDILRWDELDVLLSSARLDCLQMVKFQVVWGRHCDSGLLREVEEVVTKRLARSCARFTVTCGRANS